MRKPLKPVKAWAIHSEKRGITHAHLKRHWLENVVPVVDGKPVFDTKIIRVEIRPVQPKKRSAK